MPEAFWSTFRREWSPGFESLFEEGLAQQWYSADDPLEKCVLIIGHA